MKSTLKLPLNWEVADSVDDKISIAGIDIYRTGIFATKDTRFSLGAAAGLKPESERAYYELLERIFTQEEFVVKDSNSNAFKYSITNGNAIHSEVALARRSASNELIERDRIMRSWYGLSKPKEIVFNNSSLKKLLDIYDIKHFQFIDGQDPLSSVITCGTFLFPKNKKHHLIYGFGAGSSLQEALFKCENEVITRISFLWGEKRDENIKFVPNSNYHQEFYLNPKNHVLLLDWLKGERVHTFGTQFRSIIPNIEDDIIFKECILNHNGKRLILARANSETRIKLYFGRKYKIEEDNDLVHPVM